MPAEQSIIGPCLRHGQRIWGRCAFKGRELAAPACHGWSRPAGLATQRHPSRSTPSRPCCATALPPALPPNLPQACTTTCSSAWPRRRRRPTRRAPTASPSARRAPSRASVRRCRPRLLAAAPPAALTCRAGRAKPLCISLQLPLSAAARAPPRCRLLRCSLGRGVCLLLPLGRLWHHQGLCLGRPVPHRVGAQPQGEATRRWPLGPAGQLWPRHSTPGGGAARCACSLLHRPPSAAVSGAALGMASEMQGAQHLGGRQ